MSREIKFRVWSPVCQAMFFPVSNPLPMCDWWDSQDHTRIAVIPHDSLPVHMLGRLCYVHTLEEDWKTRLEQFTGLKDKDGRDIYEGDIVEIRCYDGWKDTTGFMVCYEVKWSSVAVGWRGFRPMMDKICMGVDVNDSPAIIGNIHESLHLLK